MLRALTQKTTMLLSASILVFGLAACGRGSQSGADDALKNDLALASQAQPYNPQQVVGPPFRDETPAPVIPDQMQSHPLSDMRFNQTIKECDGRRDYIATRKSEEPRKGDVHRGNHATRLNVQGTSQLRRT